MTDKQAPEPETALSSRRGPAAEARSDNIVPIRRISAAFGPQIAIHLLSLDERDRYLRFGYAASDRQVRDYVDGIRYDRDQIYGIFNRRLRLIAMAHLAQMDDAGAIKSAEFGVSVLRHARGRGYGALLFERAATHAVNSGIERLYIYALSENLAMLHIAQKAGAVIEHMGGESEACVRLPEPTFRSLLQERLSSHVGYVDYWLKAEAHALRHRFSGKKAVAQDHDTVVRDVDSD